VKASGAGGKIVMSKTSIGPNGFMAIFTDTEGNRVALPFYEINSVMHTFSSPDYLWKLAKICRLITTT
jgi:hypothetical protein